MLLVTALGFAKTNISITTDKTQLVMQVKDNGRLYQTYLGARLLSSVNLDELVMPRGTTSSTSAIGNEVYPVMGTEDYFEPAMEIRHADGNPTSVLKYVSHEQKSVDKNSSGCSCGNNHICNRSIFSPNCVIHFCKKCHGNSTKQYISNLKF